MSASKTLRILALAAALIGGAASPSLAEGYDGAGPTAYGFWHGTESRTPLASRDAGQDRAQDAGQAALNFLELSGATGGDGQHS
jgi:hypothetical protein